MRDKKRANETGLMLQDLYWSTILMAIWSTTLHPSTEQKKKMPIYMFGVSFPVPVDLSTLTALGPEVPVTFLV